MLWVEVCYLWWEMIRGIKFIIKRDRETNCSLKMGHKPRLLNAVSFVLAKVHD